MVPSLLLSQVINVPHSQQTGLREEATVPLRGGPLAHAVVAHPGSLLDLWGGALQNWGAQLLKLPALLRQGRWAWGGLQERR